MTPAPTQSLPEAPAEQPSLSDQPTAADQPAVLPRRALAQWLASAATVLTQGSVLAQGPSNSKDSANNKDSANSQDSTTTPANTVALPSRLYPYDTLPVRPSGSQGNRSRPVLDGRTHTGFRVEMHETELAPGLAPHPPHRHLHEELLIVNEGELAVMIAGETKTVGAGSVAYLASNVEHGWTNATQRRARYYVLTLRG